MLREISYLFRGHVWKLGFLAVASLIGACVEAASLASLVPLFSAIAGDGSVTFERHVLGRTIGIRLTADVLFLISGVFLLLRFVLQMLTAYLSSRMITGYEAEKRRTLLFRFIEASWAAQAEEQAGRLQTLLTENLAYGRLAAKSIATGLVNVANFGVLMTAAFCVDWTAAFTLAILTAVLFLLVHPFAKSAKKQAELKAPYLMDFARTVGETVLLARELRVFCVQDAVKRNLQSQIARIRRSRMISQLSGSYSSVLYMNAAVLMILAGLAAVYFGQLWNVGILVTTAMLLLRALMYGQGIQAMHHHIEEAIPYLRQIDKAEVQLSSAAVHDRGTNLGPIESIEFDDVGYHYDGTDAGVENVTFSIKRGEVVGIVGPSGSGKSTLLQLLLRLRNPTSGRIQINRRPADDASLDAWFRQLAFVSQEPQLLSVSIADNIRFFADDLTPEDIRQAAELAGIHNEVMAMPQGYDTPVGDRGARLSGGQRQRLCIARALARRPSCVVFDEPTSALDVQNDVRFQQLVTGMRGRVTAIIVTHRPATVAGCDKILVLNGGRLDTIGSPADLAASNPYFADTLRLSASDV